MPPIIVVSGSLVERAEQFALALDFVPRALEVATRNFVQTAARRATSPEAMADKIERGVARAIWTQSTAHVSGFEAAHRQYGVTLSERFGSDANRHAIAALAPDVIALTRTSFRLPRIPAGPLGCTSLAILPAATSTTASIFGRAHDLAGAAPSESRLVLHVPKQGWSHLSLHAGGAFLPGFSSVNERGLCIGVHPASTASVRRGGIALAAIATKLVESASTIDDAIAQLIRVKGVGGAIFALAQGDRTVAVEIDGDGKGAVLYPPRVHLAVGAPLRTRKNVHAFSTSECEREQSWSKLARLNALVRKHQHHDALSVANALGDDHDAYAPARTRAFGNTVFDINQVGAFVVDTAEQVLWLADGHARANKWSGLSLPFIFDQTADIRRAFGAWSPLDDHLPTLMVRSDARSREGATTTPRGKKPTLARDLHAQAARSLTLDGKRAHSSARTLFEKASALAPKEPLHALALAQLALLRGDVDAIAPLCEAIVALESSPYRGGLACWLGARAAIARADSRALSSWKLRSKDVIWGAHPRLQTAIDRLRLRSLRSSRQKESDTMPPHLPSQCDLVV